MKKATWQYFTLEEYQQRLDALRTRMAERGVDVMLIHTPENLYYMTGYQTPGYYWYQTLVVLMDREPVFVTRLLEDSNAEHLTWVEERRPYGDSEDWVAKTRDVLADLGMGSKRIGVEKKSWFLTVYDLEKLEGMLPDATFVDCSMLVEEGRVIKSAQEIEYIRQAARAAEAGVKAGIEASRVGVSENEVAAAIHSAQIRAGSEYTGLPIFITAGERSFLAHVTWYRGVIKAGDTVFLEIPGCINRYHASQIRNVYLGDPSARMLKAAGVMTDALEEMIKFIRPGVTAHDAHMLCKRVIDDGGIGVTLNHRAAYSIGIAFAPDWGEGHIISMTEGEQRELRAGMTFHVIPSVFLPGLTSVGMSETVLVTETGCEAITGNVERKLFSK
ncbi:MAG: aminopeptidase P family protein [Chloroflexi bacterium]|nr:aminopeptidase P family protein [Chloroflexota bacterium]